MPTKTWKSVERNVAGKFGTTRTPLSGGNSGHTRSDTLHSSLFIETKYRKEWPIFKAWLPERKAARDGTVTFMLTTEIAGVPELYVMFSLEDAMRYIESQFQAGREQKAISADTIKWLNQKNIVIRRKNFEPISIYRRAKDCALKEGKLPLVCMRQKSQRHTLVIVAYDDLENLMYSIVAQSQNTALDIDQRSPP